MESPIEAYAVEYSSAVARAGSLKPLQKWELIEKKLISEHDWTPEGAAALVQLARDYGSFILGHAYALSVALGIDDGELGL